MEGILRTLRFTPLIFASKKIYGLQTWRPAIRSFSEGWWRWRELNPRANETQWRLLHVYPVFDFYRPLTMPAVRPVSGLFVLISSLNTGQKCIRSQDTKWRSISLVPVRSGTRRFSLSSHCKRRFCSYSFNRCFKRPTIILYMPSTLNQVGRIRNTPRNFFDQSHYMTYINTT